MSCNRTYPSSFFLKFLILFSLVEKVCEFVCYSYYLRVNGTDLGDLIVDSAARSKNETYQAYYCLVQQGSADAAWQLAETGSNELESFTYELHWYTLASELGHKLASCQIARLLREKDPVIYRDNIIALYQEAANYGSLQAAAELVYFYLDSGSIHLVKSSSTICTLLQRILPSSFSSKVLVRLFEEFCYNDASIDRVPLSDGERQVSFGDTGII